MTINRTIFKFSPVTLVVLLSLSISGCALNDFEAIPYLPTDVAPGAPSPAKFDVYRIQVGDVLDIKFPLNPELNETVTVRPDGRISTAIAHDIEVYNMTVSEVNSSIDYMYRESLKNPRVSVVVRSFAPSRIYVSGEVVSPGEFVVIGPALTLTQAIARAGGVKNSGETENVLVIRRGAGEKNQIFRADYNGATQLGDATKDVRLAPYDVVFVPKSDVALNYKAYEQNVQQFIQPSIGFNASYQLNPDNSR